MQLITTIITIWFIALLFTKKSRKGLFNIFITPVLEEASDIFNWLKDKLWREFETKGRARGYKDKILYRLWKKMVDKTKD